MGELYLDGYLFDIEPNSIRNTMQVNDLADLRSRNASRTNNFLLLNTPKNIQQLNNLGIVGNNSRIQYKSLTANYFVEGIHLIRNGKAAIEYIDDLELFQCAIFYGTKNLINQIGDRRLDDLDYSNFQSVLDNINTFGKENTFSNDEDFIFAISNTSIIPDNVIPATYPQNDIAILDFDLIQPYLYLHTIIDKIQEQNQITFIGDVFAYPKYKNKVISMTSWVTKQGLVRADVKEVFPNLKQSDILKAFMNMFGLLFRPIDDRTYEFYELNEIFESQETAEDWSSKLIKKLKEGYSFSDYGINNLIEIPEANGFKNYLEWNLIIDNETLQRDSILFKSPFATNNTFFEVADVKIHNHEIQEDGKDKSCTPHIFTVERVDINVIIGDSNNPPDFTTDVPILNHTDLSGKEIINTHYLNIAKALNRFKAVDLLLDLNSIDALNLDFFKLKYFHQLNGYYYLNKVKDFIEGSPTVVEMVEVNLDYDYDLERESIDEDVQLLPIASLSYSSNTTPLDQGPNIDSFEFVVEVAHNTSTSPNGETLSYSWRQTSGVYLCNVEYLNASRSSVKFYRDEDFRVPSPTPPATNDQFTFELTVYNESGYSDKTTFTLTVT